MESSSPLFAPSRGQDNAAKVGPFEVRIEEREYVVIDSAEGCFRFVAKAVMEGVNDLLLKVIAAGMCVDDCFALDIGHVEVAHPQDIHFDPRRDEGNFRLLVLGNARSGMQRDGVPHYLDSSFADAMLAEELTGGVSTVYLKPFCRTAVFLRQAHVMEHGSNVEEFRIEF